MAEAYRDQLGNVVPILKMGVTQHFSYTTVAGVLPGPVGNRTHAVRLRCTTAAFYRVTQDGALATTSYVPLDAGVVEVVQIPPNGYISAIRESADGIFYVTECG